MGETIDESVYQHIRESEAYKTVLGALADMVDDGDECAIETMAMINALIPPEERKQTPPGYGQPQAVPPIRKPEVEKKHIKRP